jgi:SsrA-binding protein
MSESGEKLIADNRRARHDYHLLERFEAGLVLTGSEVKSLRQGQATLTRAYAEIRGVEAWLIGAHIAPYRDRKLLLHSHQLASLGGELREKGLTLVPTRLYFKAGRVKVELALARGKVGRDKREDIASRDAQREMERALKGARDRER